MRAWISTIVCAALFTGIAHAGELASDDKHGISLRVPDGFQAFPAGAIQRAIFSFSRGEPGSPGFELLAVMGLGGTIGREAFDPSPIIKQIALPLELTIVRSSRRALSWKDFELDGFVATMSQGDVTATLAGVQVPVRGEAVQIIMVRLGDVDVGGELQTVLAGFSAESNWLTTDERIQKVVVGGLTFLTTVGLIVFFVIRRRRRARDQA